MAKNIDIGGRLHSVATEHIVAGANEIKDDALQKTQSTVNTEVAIALNDRYTKSDIDEKESDLNDRITATQQQDIVVVTDHAEVINPDSKKIYREQGESSYTDYMYQEGEWKLLAEFTFPGTDDKPIYGSDNLVTSDGIVKNTIAEKEFSISEENVISYIVDKNNTVLGKIMSDGSVEWLVPNSKDIIVNGKIENIEELLSYVSSEIQDNDNIVKYITDKENKVICEITVNGDVCFKGGGGFDFEKTSSENINLDAIKVITDSKGVIICWIDIEGKIHIESELNSKAVSTDKLNLSDEAISNLQQSLNINNSVYPVDSVFNMPIPHPTNDDGKELYSELPVYNVERRACQLRFIRWTALSPIPKNLATGGYYTGQQTGLPYASCMEIDKFVGYDISFLTFMTAANNPYSMLYTENLRDNGSVYGFTYHTGRRTIAGWAGIVCNIMETYSTGMKIPYDTGMWDYLNSINRLVKVYNQEAQGVRIGDFLWQQGHGRMVQNIWRGDNGLVEKIEAVTGGMERPEYMFNSPEDFDHDLENRKGIIYRNTELYNNINYEELPFTLYSDNASYREIHDLDDSGEDTFDYNNDICTYAGDYACFREGFRIVINYNLKEDKDWNIIELYKNDVLYGTYELADDVGVYDRGPENYPSEKAELIPSHSFDLSFLNLTYGKYKARLVDPNNTYSDYTYFEILETKVQFEIQPNAKTKIMFSSTNGNPIYIRWSAIHGGPKGLYELTQEEIDRGYCTVDVSDLVKKQYNNLYTGNTYLKVYFKGEYGCVTNEPILYN